MVAYIESYNILRWKGSTRNTESSSMKLHEGMFLPGLKAHCQVLFPSATHQTYFSILCHASIKQEGRSQAVLGRNFPNSANLSTARLGYQNLLLPYVLPHDSSTHPFTKGNHTNRAKTPLSIPEPLCTDSTYLFLQRQHSSHSTYPCLHTSQPSDSSSCFVPTHRCSNIGLLLDMHIGPKPEGQGGKLSSSLSCLHSPGKAPSSGDRIYISPAFGLSDDEDNNLKRWAGIMYYLTGQECTLVVFSPQHCLQAGLMGLKMSESTTKAIHPIYCL